MRGGWAVSNPDAAASCLAFRALLIAIAVLLFFTRRLWWPALMAAPMWAAGGTSP